MKQIYFIYPKYLFSIFLIYTLYVLSGLPDAKIGATEIVLGFVFPIIPVWLAVHFTKKLDKDLNGSMLNMFALLLPAIVISIEVYLIYTLSLVAGGTGTGLLAAFGAGGLVFFILLCTTMMLSVFAKNKLP